MFFCFNVKTKQTNFVLTNTQLINVLGLRLNVKVEGPPLLPRRAAKVCDHIDLEVLQDTLGPHIACPTCKSCAEEAHHGFHRMYPGEHFCDSCVVSREDALGDE